MKKRVSMVAVIGLAGFLVIAFGGVSVWAAEPTEMQVYVYEHTKYEGAYMRFDGLRQEPDLRCYNTGGLNTPNWNDRISSLKVGSGVKLKVYKDINYKGSSWTITGPAGMSTLVPNKWNDKISSFIIAPK
ncbi:MAG: peptidase inhibitor family I36 protein [Deltaproteobacteria bacterium]|nr:peptidase inhibitor family I36 protein [Deltaproteobacteria bacterium]